MPRAYLLCVVAVLCGRLQHVPILLLLYQAPQAECLDARSLSSINAYNPGLSCGWMFQRAMSLRPGQTTKADFINRLLAGNFATMDGLGTGVLKPFLQDVIQCGPLARTLGSMMVTRPSSVPEILLHVGPGPLAEWTVHFAALAAYAALDSAAAPALRALAEGPMLTPKQRYAVHRTLDAWRYGAGRDYEHH